MQAVKRDPRRFPEDFMFQLDAAQVRRFEITNCDFKLGRCSPGAFTEQGVAIFSIVLKSRRAVQVNIGIMRAFVQIRRMLGGNRDLARKLEELEKKYDSQLRIVFDAIRQLMPPAGRPAKRPIGFVSAR